MVYIAICDDEENIGVELECSLTKIFRNSNIKHEIDIFYTGEELCAEIEKKHYDLILLDIEFAKDKINGIEVGKRIRETYQNHIVSIVYISWESNYALELFEIQPLHFLIKPLDNKKIGDTIKKYIKNTGLTSGTFTYKKSHDTFKVQKKDIIYIESYDRKLILHMTNGRKDEFYGSIKEIFDNQLSKFDFLFIHKSYIVNYDYISAMKFDSVFLISNDTPLPISKHRKIEVRENYFAITQKREG